MPGGRWRDKPALTMEASEESRCWASGNTLFVASPPAGDPDSPCTAVVAQARGPSFRAKGVTLHPSMCSRGCAQDIGPGAALEVPNSMLHVGATSLEGHGASAEETKFFPPLLVLREELSSLLCPGFSSLRPEHGAEMGLPGPGRVGSHASTFTHDTLRQALSQHSKNPTSDPFPSLSPSGDLDLLCWMSKALIARGLGQGWWQNLVSPVRWQKAPWSFEPLGSYLHGDSLNFLWTRPFCKSLSVPLLCSLAVPSPQSPGQDIEHMEGTGHSVLMGNRLERRCLVCACGAVGKEKTRTPWVS